MLAVLRSPVYLGEFANGDSTRPGCHEPVVDRETFQAVQRQLDDRRPPSKSERRRVPFPLRGKLICLRCRRRLCTYTVTRRRGLTTIGYRYYRCRSTAGGRAPCRGVQYPAGEVEQAARDVLADPQTWRAMIDAENAPTPGRADLLMAVWTGLDIATQDRLISGIAELVQFNRRNTEMRLSFADGFRSAIEDHYRGFEADDG